MLILPISDDNPTLHHAKAMRVILLACCLIFGWQMWQFMQFGAAGFHADVQAYGLVPARLLGTAQDLPPHFDTLPPFLTIFTSMFMHGSSMHLIGNMLYLYIFADNIEDMMGWRRFVGFYLLCGIAAALAQAWVNPHSAIPMIGASGAIAGVLGGYLLAYPRANVRVLIFFYIVNIPAYIVLGAWIAMQFFNLGQMSGDGGGVAYLAHIGGFIAGVVLIAFFKRSNARLLQKPVSTAFHGHRLRMARHVPVTKARRRAAPPPGRARAHPWDD